MIDQWEEKLIRGEGKGKAVGLLIRTSEGLVASPKNPYLLIYISLFFFFSVENSTIYISPPFFFFSREFHSLLYFN